MPHANINIPNPFANTTLEPAPPPCVSRQVWKLGTNGRIELEIRTHERIGALALRRIADLTRQIDDLARELTDAPIKGMPVVEAVEIEEEYADDEA